jgi:predicted MFS family arabinose efflux permease
VDGRRLEPLRVRPFARLLVAYTVNELGDAVGIVALALLVFDRTDAVAPTAGFFLIAKFLPAFFATGLTAHVDRLPLRRALPALYAVEALVFAALGYLAENGRFLLPAVLVLGFLDGTLAITGRGLTRGAVATVLQPRELIGEGNALMNFGFAVASVGGAALGGGLIAAFGLPVALFLDAVSFLVIAVLLATSRRLPVLDHSEHERWLTRLRAGIGFARGHRLVRMLMAGQSVALICFTLVVPIEVIYAKDSLGTTSAGFGILLSAWGAGIVLGSLLFLALKSRSGFGLIVVASAAVGVAYLGMSAANTLVLACAMSVVGGAGNGTQWVAVMTALQKVTPPEYQARVSGLLESIGAALPGVGFLIGGAIAAVTSPRTAFAVAGAGILALVLIALALRPGWERRDGAQTSTTTGSTMGRRLSRS